MTDFKLNHEFSQLSNRTLIFQSPSFDNNLAAPPSTLVHFEQIDHKYEYFIDQQELFNEESN